MTLFTFSRGGRWQRVIHMLALFLATATLLAAQPAETNAAMPGPGEISSESGPATNAAATNAAPAVPSDTSTPAAPASVTPAPTPVEMAAPAITASAPLPVWNFEVLAALMTFASLGGLLLYQCGLTRAKNVGHTSMLLVVGVVVGLTGYWIGGFAVQMGGIGDAHAALAQPIPPAERLALDHELGPVAMGHHWGIMGSAGFFLATDDPSRDGIATLFLIQAAWLALAIGAALGAALERARLLSMAFCAYLIGVLIYPLLADWIWGGGWLAELGREFGLGHGLVDIGGGAVVHETAGVLALVITVVLGPRHGRFGRNKTSDAIPGHNLPFVILGSIILLISWMAANAFASTVLISDNASSNAALAAIDTLLAASAGLIASFLQSAWQKRRPEPARLCRGLLGGAVASCAGAGLLDPWAAFLIGAIAGLLVQAAMNTLERKRIDDPVGATAVHGAAGAWGVIAVGFFANGDGGMGYNGADKTVRGLFFGGGWHQLVAQIIGCVTTFVVIYLLGYACVSLVQKILGNRVALADETEGLDLPEIGTLGYQGDVELDEDNGKS
jgi:ammonium transporter, Amt family